MLTDTLLKKLKGRKYPYRVYDKTVGDPGFGVQVTPSGYINFFLAYQVDGKERFMNLGSYSDWTLADARKRSRDERKLLDMNEDPQEVRKAEKLAKAEKKLIKKSRGTVDVLFDCYSDWLEDQGKRSASQVKRFKKAYISPVIGSLYVADLKPDDVRAVLRPIIQRKKMVLANRVRAYLVASLNFAISWKDKPNYTPKIRFDITMNPAQVVEKPLKSEAPGDRVLTEKEIKTLWKKWEGEFPGEVLRLILASGGQRVEEVLHAKWGEFDFKKKLWSIPAGRTKSGRWHVVPMSSLMVDELNALKAKREREAEDAEVGAGISAFLFPGKGDTGPIRTDSLGQAIRRFCDDKEYKGEAYTARDLRRTVKTHMGWLRVPKEDRDRLQGHAMLDVSSKHYDRYDYLAEKLEAINKWTKYLKQVVAGKKKVNVVHLEKKG